MSIDAVVIMAAGLGSRIPEHSKHAPKGFISVAGQPIIERSIDILVRYGIQRIIIGTGYKALGFNGLAKCRTEARISCVFNANFENSGSLETLLQCTEGLDCDFLTLESDLLYDSRMIWTVMASAYDNVILASSETQSGDEVYIQTNADSELVSLSKDPTQLAQIDAELVGICKLTPQIPTMLKQWLQQSGHARPAQLHYEEGLVGIARQTPLHVEKTDLPWTEIDTLAQLERANNFIWPRIAAAEKGRL
jgi:choline kinase